MARTRASSWHARRGGTQEVQDRTEHSDDEMGHGHPHAGSHNTAGIVRITHLACCHEQQSSRHRPSHPHRAGRSRLDAGSIGRGGRRIPQRGRSVGNRACGSGNDEPDAHCRGTRCRRRTSDVRPRQSPRQARSNAAMNLRYCGYTANARRKTGSFCCERPGDWPKPPADVSRASASLPSASPPGWSG